MTHIWAYQGKYRGHIWGNVDDELSFAIHDLEHAYVGLIDAPLNTSSISAAKEQMDQAMDRIVRAIAQRKR